MASQGLHKSLVGSQNHQKLCARTVAPTQDWLRHVFDSMTQYLNCDVRRVIQECVFCSYGSLKLCSFEASNLIYQNIPKYPLVTKFQFLLFGPMRLLASLVLSFAASSAKHHLWMPLCLVSYRHKHHVTPTSPDWVIHWFWKVFHWAS